MPENRYEHTRGLSLRDRFTNSIAAAVVIVLFSVIAHPDDELSSTLGYVFLAFMFAAVFFWGLSKLDRNNAERFQMLEETILKTLNPEDADDESSDDDGQQAEEKE